MTSWTLIKSFLMFVLLGNTRRKKLKFFSKECLLFFYFFQKNLFSTTYQVIEKWPFYLHQTCLNILWSVIKLLWTSAKLSITRKKGKGVVFSMERELFFKNLCFQPSLSFCRNDLVNCTKIVWIFFGPLELIPDVALLSNTRENRSKLSGR